MKQIKVVKNASWIIATRIIQSILSLIISMITARYLGPSNFGLINYASSIVAFTIPIMQLGLTSIIVQELIENPDKEGELIGTSLGACFLSAIMNMVGIILFILILNRNEPETIIVCALYSFMILAQSFEIFNYWFQAKLISKYTSIVSLVAYTLVSIYKIFLLITEKSVRWFAISNALDYFIIAIVSIVLYKRLGGKKLTFSKDTLKRLLHKSKYYIISGLMITVFAQTDRVMLKLMINESATGYYSAAVSCAAMTGFIFCAIIDSARPVIFESKMLNQMSFYQNMVRLYNIVVYMALLQSVGITIFAKLIIVILYGKTYLPAVSALRIIVWYTAFSYIGSIRNIWLLAEGKQHLIWKIDLSGACVNVVLNIVLIPIWGINGAAFASLITQIFTNVIIGMIIKELRPNNVLILKSLNPKEILKLIKLFASLRKE